MICVIEIRGSNTLEQLPLADGRLIDSLARASLDGIVRTIECLDLERMYSILWFIYWKGNLLAGGGRARS